MSTKIFQRIVSLGYHASPHEAVQQAVAFTRKSIDAFLTTGQCSIVTESQSLVWCPDRGMYFFSLITTIEVTSIS